MSEFIERSKDPRGTAAIESHFSGGNVGRKPGTDPMLKAPPGGSAAWNPPPTTSESNSDVNSEDQSPAGPSMFNASNPPRPRETGVNYSPKSHVGNRVTDDPFQGNADGMPGSQRKLWR
jgi:hypothetical protein